MCVIGDRLCLAYRLSENLIKPLHLWAGEWQRFVHGFLQLLNAFNIKVTPDSCYSKIITSHFLRNRSFKWTSTCLQWWFIDPITMYWFSEPAKSGMLLDFHSSKLNINMKKINWNNGVWLFSFLHTLTCESFGSHFFAFLFSKNAKKFSKSD